MAMSNRERVGRGMELLRDGLGPYVLRECLAALPRAQADAVVNRLFPDGAPKQAENEAQLIERMDVQEVIFVMWDFWREAFHEKLGHSGRTLVSELRNVRNDWAHLKPFSLDDAHRALDSMTRLLEMVSAPQAEETRDHATALLRQKFEAEVERSKKLAAEEVSGSSVKGLRPWQTSPNPTPTWPRAATPRPSSPPTSGRCTRAGPARSTETRESSSGAPSRRTVSGGSRRWRSSV